jgi:ATP-binding cassette subfamily B protein
VLDLRRLFGLVLQEPLLFGVSVADNIRYSRAGATRDEIVAAARVAEIHSTIEALPDGYDSVVGGRRGVRLSVGQKQRVSIARAVLANPAILIMDEATSSLDTESERAIQHAMSRFLRDRTAFVVAHRLSTIRSADRIVMLRDGAIGEIGTHDELMRAPNGVYREMYLKHMGKGILTEE